MTGRRRGGQRGLGYSYAHKMRRKKALAAFVEGTACELCGHPMYRAQRLHLDHKIPRVLGGEDGPVRLVHGRCNELRGVALSNARRRARRGRTGSSRSATSRVRRVALPEW